MRYTGILYSPAESGSPADVLVKMAEDYDAVVVGTQSGGERPSPGLGPVASRIYPPFSLKSDPDYPADLTVQYPDSLSKGTTFVQWWILAVPHYLVVAIFQGGVGYRFGVSAAPELGHRLADQRDPPADLAGGALIA